MNKLAPAPSHHQQRASNPETSVWVSANAGSGKTQVLVDRVIRLMLAGTEPSRILCLTFTRAAAAEMSKRLFDRLGKWISFDDDKLDQEIAALGTRPVTREIRLAARKLFTRALETPGGLKIQTIHAFSERLLQLFPVEAGIVPGFEIMDERTAGEMLGAARRTVIVEAEADPGSALGNALRIVTALVQAKTFDALMSEILNRRSVLDRILADSRIMAEANAALRDRFGLAQHDDMETVTRELTGVDIRLYQEMIDTLETQSGKATNRDTAEALRLILAAGPHSTELLRELFLTGENECRKPNSLMTKKLREVFPAIADKLGCEQQRVFAGLGKLTAIEMLEGTKCLLTLASRILAHYEAAKRRRGAYDFNDLIHRTRTLLRERPQAAWVLYKFDGGIDHILVDEAQDTSPEQWAIVMALAEEFFSGSGARPDVARTLFVVGDRKQSIFSFQGADPDAFDAARAHFEASIRGAGQKFDPVPLTVSYRSTPDILSAVDCVFEDAVARRGLNARLDDDVIHETSRTGQAGLVELWPRAGKPEKRKPDPWTLPLDHRSADHPASVLARRIADTIASWIGKRTIVSRGRPVRPDDILILVRSRDRFFDSIIRELHHRKIPVAGADRIKLNEHIAIQDLVALGRFVILPEDDYSLACLLKSPLVAYQDGRSFGDDDLFAIAHGRGSASLWQKVQNTPSLADIRGMLERWSLLARSAAPFEFFTAILTEGRPNARQRLLGRLGEEANDLIDAFLDLALDYERSHAPSLQGFLAWLASADTEIKRDMEQGSGEVRVMTVHGAKGLEANIVILPDSCATPDGRTEAKLMLVEDGAGKAVPLWRLSGRVEPAALTQLRAAAEARTMEEYRRQLYVAMTRARDELYVCGHGMQEKLKEGCWYELVRRGLAQHKGAAAVDGAIRIAGSQTGKALDRIDGLDDRFVAAEPPDWAIAVAPARTRPSRWRAPSKLLSPQTTEFSAEAVRRGRALHKLFQLLPDLPEADRVAAARRMLGRRGFSSAEAVQVAEAALAIIRNPQFSPFFATGLAEVPLAAHLNDSRIGGQIDRLVITEGEAFILDFKTDRMPPQTADHVSLAYKAQLAAYRAGLLRIFPEKQVRAALLYTEGPVLLELPPALLDTALDPGPTDPYL